MKVLAQKLGGHLAGFHYCFREYDGIGLIDLPDDIAAIATSVAAVAPGHIKAIKTTRLFTVEETMKAVRTVGGLAFQGPSEG